jgi:hypothetical protein
MGEFNVNKTTGGLNPTAGMPEKYPAEQVMMSDGVTSVEEAVDGLKILKDVIDLSSYNSISNMYTFPKDGYLFLVSDYDTSAAGFSFYTNLNQWMGSIKVQAGYNGMQVKKGTRGFCVITGAGASVKFCPFYVN